VLARQPARRIEEVTLSQYRVVEICAGAGGQSLGLELAGFEHDLSVEFTDRPTCHTALYRGLYVASMCGTFQSSREHERSGAICGGETDLEGRRENMGRDDSETPARPYRGIF
jgi:hypothetical protein